MSGPRYDPDGSVSPTIMRLASADEDVPEELKQIWWICERFQRNITFEESHAVKNMVPFKMRIGTKQSYPVFVYIPADQTPGNVNQSMMGGLHIMWEHEEQGKSRLTPLALGSAIGFSYNRPFS